MDPHAAALRPGPFDLSCRVSITGPCGIGASYFEARGGEHGLGSGVEGRLRHSDGLEPGHIDRMTLDGRRAILAGELDSGFQEGRSDAGWPEMTVDGEAGDPGPGAWRCGGPGRQFRDSGSGGFRGG